MISNAIFFLAYAIFAGVQTARVSKRSVQTIQICFNKWRNGRDFFPTNIIHLLLGRLGLLVLTIGTGLDNLRNALQCISSLLYPEETVFFFLQQKVEEQEQGILENAATTIIWNHQHHEYGDHPILHSLRQFLLSCAFGHYVLTPIAMFSILQLFCCTGNAFSSHCQLRIGGRVVEQDRNKRNCRCLGISSLVVLYMVWFQYGQFINGPAEHPIQIKLLEQQHYYRAPTTYYTFAMTFASHEDNVNGLVGVISWQLTLILLFATILLQEIIMLRLPRQPKRDTKQGTIDLHDQQQKHHHYYQEGQSCDNKRRVMIVAMWLFMNVGCILWHALSPTIVQRYCKDSGGIASLVPCEGSWFSTELVTNFAEQIAIRSHVWVDHVVNDNKEDTKRQPKTMKID